MTTFATRQTHILIGLLCLMSFTKATIYYGIHDNQTYQLEKFNEYKQTFPEFADSYSFTTTFLDKNITNFCTSTPAETSLHFLNSLTFSPNSAFSEAMLYNEGYLYLFANMTTLAVFSIPSDPHTNPYLPIAIGTITTDLAAPNESTIEFASQMMIVNNDTLLVLSNSNLCLFNISTASAPLYISCNELQASSIFDVQIYNGVYYVSMEINGINLINGTTWETIVNLGNDFFNPEAGAIQMLDLQVDSVRGILYAVDNYNGLQVINVSNPTNITLITTIPFPGTIFIKSYEDAYIVAGILNLPGTQGRAATGFVQEFQFQNNTVIGSDWDNNLYDLRYVGSLPGINGLSMDDKYVITILSNLFYLARHSIPEEAVPLYNDISQTIIEKNVKNALLAKIVNSPQMTLGNKNNGTRLVIILTATGFSVSLLQESPPTFGCFVTNNATVNKFNYIAKVVTSNCAAKEIALDNNITSLCDYTFNITVNIEEPYFSSSTEALAIGLGVGLSISVIILIFCLYYCTKTKQYQRLMENSTSRKDDFYRGSTYADQPNGPQVQAEPNDVELNFYNKEKIAA